MKGVGEPCAGDPHARFDGGSWRRSALWQPIQCGPRETEELEPGFAYGSPPRQLPTQPPPWHRKRTCSDRLGAASRLPLIGRVTTCLDRDSRIVSMMPLRSGGVRAQSIKEFYR